MTFRCQQCGKCCSHMGELIRIEEKTGPMKFRIRFVVTGNEMDVIVDEDKQALFRNKELNASQPDACPLLRLEKNKQAVCTIHHTSPDLCRIYACFRLLVLGPDGDHGGRVKDGTRFFSTMNADLRKIWENEIEGVIIPDETAWENFVGGVFEQAGYRVVK
ncbi:MAG: YkgJ family cysteine cluster protein [Methanoregula sp.]